MTKPLHLIQPVGFSLPNIVCALAHNRINTATLLYTSEIPKEHINRAIEIANECRKKPLSPDPILVMIPSPDADAKGQFDVIQQISIPQYSDVVVGVTGGTQRLMGTLVSRFGTDRLLWVSNEPEALLKIGGKTWSESLEMAVEDYERLYGLEEIQVSPERISISDGRLSFSKDIHFPPYTIERRKPWAKNARVKVGNVADEIKTLEQKFGRIQFRYNLIITTDDDLTYQRVVTILGRLPKSVNITINNQKLVDPIESIAVESSITEGYMTPDLYEILEPFQPLQNVDTLHLLVGKYNSIPVANSILNHQPKRICLWALNHSNDKDEIQLLCNQVFTIQGWINGTLDRDMGVSRLTNNQSPKCPHLPDQIFFMNKNVHAIEGALEELYEICDFGNTIIDVSSGSGQLSSLLIQAISKFSPNPIITYTHPWTGEITNLSTGEISSGKVLPIVDRLWLSQRPIISYDEAVNLDSESEKLLCDIAERTRDNQDYSISPKARGGRTSHSIPRESWGDVSVQHLRSSKKPRKPDRIQYSRGKTALEFQMPIQATTSGYWIDDLMRYALPYHFQPLDCITSVGVMTERKDSKVNDIEIDAIFMEKDGLTFVSCKKGKDAWNIKAFKETLSWEALIGGPNSKSIIVHSNIFYPDTEERQFSWMESSPRIKYLHWFDLLGVEFEMLNAREEEE